MFLVISVFLVVSCSGPQKPKPQTPHSDPVLVEALSLHLIKIRRPLGTMPDPKSGPGGLDYKSSEEPSKNWDCKSIEKLFAGMNPTYNRAEISKCGESLTGIREYVLQRSPRPVLKLIPVDQPSCLDKWMPVIPLPREIVYFSSKAECMTTRIDVEADRILGFKLPIRQSMIKVKFPIEPTSLWVESIVLTTFWNPELKGFASYPMSQKLCMQCMDMPKLKDIDEKMILDPVSHYPSKVSEL